MLSSGTHDLVRDRSGQIRRLYERAHVDFGHPEKQDHFRWRAKLSGGANVMQAERLEAGRMALARRVEATRCRP